MRVDSSGARSVLDSRAPVRSAGVVQRYQPGSRQAAGQRTGLARALSKLGVCSRSEASQRIRAGDVRVNGVIAYDPLAWVEVGRDRIDAGGQLVRGTTKLYLMLNKPRGLVTTAADEKGRDTVFQCLEGASLPFVSPVGRLDQASEGLLLFTNDTSWASRITDPSQHLDKVYHVQIDTLADAELIRRMTDGVLVEGVRFRAKRVAVLRRGEKNSWLEIVLDEGKNRHIRRLLEELGLEALRLVRVAIGSLKLGELVKGGWRHLTKAEIAGLAGSDDRNPKARRGATRS